MLKCRNNEKAYDNYKWSQMISQNFKICIETKVWHELEENIRFIQNEVNGIKFYSGISLRESILFEQSLHCIVIVLEIAQ